MEKRTQEWLIQADYDMDTADYMFQGGRYFYAVFMCHLSVEKALKGMYTHKHGKIPPKIHNFVYFIKQNEIEFPEELLKVILKLNESNVTTRYPNELTELIKLYTKPIVQEFLSAGKEALKWIKQML